jgi:hypothetical protein
MIVLKRSRWRQFARAAFAHRFEPRCVLRAWIPAFAGTTITEDEPNLICLHYLSNHTVAKSWFT